MIATERGRPRCALCGTVGVFSEASATIRADLSTRYYSRRWIHRRLWLEGEGPRPRVVERMIHHVFVLGGLPG